MTMRSVLGPIDCLLLILVVSGSCILTFVHILYGFDSKESRHKLPISRSCLQMIAGMADTAFSHTCCQFCNRDLHINIIHHYIHSCSYLDVERISLWYNKLQLNDVAYVYLMNQNTSYVTLVLLGLIDNACCLVTSLKGVHDWSSQIMVKSE